MAEHGFQADHTDMQADAAVAIAQQVTPNLTMTGGFESGEMTRAFHRPRDSAVAGWRETPYRAASISARFDRRRVGVTVGATVLDEAATTLGARFSTNLGAQSARTLFARVGLDAQLPADLSVAANLQRGWTQAAAGGALRNGGSLVGQSWSADLARRNLLARGDLFGLRISLPLRVIASRFDLVVPQAWDWEREIASETRVPLNLVPRGRQRDYELSYGRGIGPGWLGANLFLRQQGGNIAAMPEELGAALRWSVGF